jgi:3-hydroxyacyl-CoA dehydrogenase
MYIFKAAVIGAGAMGAEIAQVISFSGLPVVLKDVDQKMLDKGMERIRKIYGWQDVARDADSVLRRFF